MFDTKRKILAIQGDVKTLQEKVESIIQESKEGDYILITGVNARNQIELDSQRELIESALKKLDIPGNVHLLVVPTNVEIKGFQRVG